MRPGGGTTSAAEIGEAHSIHAARLLVAPGSPQRGTTLPQTTCTSMHYRRTRPHPTEPHTQSSRCERDWVFVCGD